MLTIRENVPLKEYNTLALPAAARYLAVVRSIDDVRQALEFANEKDVPLLPLGEGSNIVFSGDFEGLVLLIEFRGKQIMAEDEEHCWLNVAAGENWHELVRFCLDHEYYGIENLALIPGTAGAAPIQNIGAYGVELSDSFVELEAVNLDSGKLRLMTAAECSFGYRDSVFKREQGSRWLICSITLRLAKHFQPQTTYAALADYLAERRISHPAARDVFKAVVSIRQSKLPDPSQVPNAGSFFKNPVVDAATFAAIKEQYGDVAAWPQADGNYKLAAGWLLEKDGWKGGRFDGVGLHDEQALVLVNRGGATGKEVLELAERIRQSVRDRFGVELEIEPRVY
jgi:UDP-N-acetylmuramate dehydrogenase